MSTKTELKALTADDAYSMSFQSIGQYRAALLKAIDDADRSAAHGEQNGGKDFPALK